MITLPWQPNDDKGNRRCWYFSQKDQTAKVYMQHGPQYLSWIQTLLDDFAPELIIELGTLGGAFTLFLHEHCPEVRLHTFDCHKLKGPILNLFNHSKVTFHVGDLLTHGDKELIAILRNNRNVRKFLYCDNGDKPKEAELYCDYLSVGDMIGFHDWDTEYRGFPVECMLKDKGFLPIIMNVGLVWFGEVFSRFFIREMKNDSK